MRPTTSLLNANNQWLNTLLISFYNGMMTAKAVDYVK